MDAKKVLEDIANMSVDCAKAMDGKYPQELIEAFTLAGKYITIGTLKKEARKDISPAVGPDKCPLCLLYLHQGGTCRGCVLHDKGTHLCGEKYNVLRDSIENGTFLNAAFHLGSILREVLKKWS